jgi:hypothetical protein
MNPSYARVRLPLGEAMERFSSHINPHELEPPTEVTLSNSVARSVDSNGHWRGGAKFIYEKDGWTIFEDLSGHLGGLSGESWLDFAGDSDFVFAGYNDAIGYGELIVIQSGAVVREFFCDTENRACNLDAGMLPEVDPLKTWIEVARFVDDDSIVFAEKGLLCIHGPRT